MGGLHNYVKEFNETYSLLFEWFYEKFDYSLLISESDDILDFIEKYQNDTDNIIQMFRYEYEIIMTSHQLQELKELIKTIK